MTTTPQEKQARLDERAERRAAASARPGYTPEDWAALWEEALANAPVEIGSAQMASAYGRMAANPGPAERARLRKILDAQHESRR